MERGISARKSIRTVVLASMLLASGACSSLSDGTIPSPWVLPPGSSGGSSGTPCTTPGVAHKDYSLITASATTARLNEAAEVTLTLTARDCNNTLVGSGGETVAFGHSTGTSTLSISATNDVGDGTYTATVTGTAVGTQTNITATLNAAAVTTGPVQSIEVIWGRYRRTVGLAPATDRADMQVKMSLSSSNFTFANAQAAGQDLRITDATDSTVLFDYWIERYDQAGQNAILWVQVPAAGTSSMHIYYGNSNLAAASNKLATFSYSTAQDLYVELSPEGISAGQSSNIASYFNGNDVTVEEFSGSTNGTINRLAFTNFSQMIQGVISATGGISGRGLNSNRAFDTIIPLNFASTRMGYPRSRYANDKWSFYNPSSSTTANVSVLNYTSAGAYVNQDDFTVGPQAFVNRTFDVSSFGLVESDLDVVSFYSADAGGDDSASLVPAASELCGINSQNAYIGIMEDNTDVDIYYSGSATQNLTGLMKGAQVVLTGGGSQGNAMGVKIVSTKNVIASSQADSDGVESMTFWGRDQLDDEYILPARAQYVSIACPYTTNITIYQAPPNETLTDKSGVCTPAGMDPGFLQLLPTGARFNELQRIAGDQVFFVYYEYEDQDETNILGSKHSRLYTANPSVASIGSETTL